MNIFKWIAGDGPVVEGPSIVITPSASATTILGPAYNDARSIAADTTNDDKPKQKKSRKVSDYIASM
jgi:hypothetical protein